jgi:hypothetical protein
MGKALRRDCATCTGESIAEHIERNRRGESFYTGQCRRIFCADAARYCIEGPSFNVEPVAVCHATTHLNDGSASQVACFLSPWLSSIPI